MIDGGIHFVDAFAAAVGAAGVTYGLARGGISEAS